MSELPPTALEEQFDGKGGTVFRQVEAPPCGERLDMPEHGVWLVCDLPRGHPINTKHCMVLAGKFPLRWCDDNCAHHCDGPLSTLYKLRCPGGTP